MDWDVIISGAGLGGLCAASGLQQAGRRVLVLERDESAKARQQGYRININLAGDAALRQCLPPAHYALYRDTSHRQLDPSVDIFAPDLRPVLHRVADVPANGLPPAAVDRATLRAILLGAAQNVRFSAPVVNATETGREVQVELGDGMKLTCGLLVAADGASSRLRRKIIPGNDPQPLGVVALYSKTPLDSTRPAWVPNGLLQQRFVGVTDNAGTTLALGAWYPRRYPAEAARDLVPGLALPVTAPYIMCVLLIPAEAAPPSAAGAEELHEFMAGAIRDWHPAVTQFVRDADVAATFRITLRAVSSVPDWSAGRITFLGDAVHAMSPAGGEGANTAMADAASLVIAFEKNGIGGIATYESDMRQRARTALERSMHYGSADRTKDTHHV
jgi:2-polyprenyl-6-methoxyphenol hydroxylase-like FAD-dependent oxidoreductase